MVGFKIQVMATTILSNYLLAIKNQVASQEVSFLKLEALLQVILGTDFYNHPKSIIYDYLLTIYDILNATKKVNSSLVATLSFIKAQPMGSANNETFH